MAKERIMSRSDSSFNLFRLSKGAVQLILCGFALGIPLLPFLIRATVWPAGDFDGHLATIELYRSSLAQGVLWPYDYHAGLGNDAVPYYGWYFELLCGFLALVVSWALSSTVAVTIVGVSIGYAALAVLPWIFAEALELENASWVLTALLLSALFACLPSDTFTPNGGSMIFDFGMLTSFVGLVLLVWFTVLLQRYEQDDKTEFGVAIPLVLAAITGTHPLSAFLAGVLTGLSGIVVLFTRRPKKCIRLVQVFITGLLLSAPCVHALIATSAEHNSFVDTTAPAGLSLLGAILSLHQVWKLPLAFLLGIVSLSSVRDWKSLFFRGGICFSLLPISGVLPVLGSSVHAYRLFPVGSILLLIAGMRSIAALCKSRPHWIPWIRPVILGGIVYGMILWVLPRIPTIREVQMHPEFIASFGSVYNRSTYRVLIADEENYKAPFFKHGVELAAHLYDFESANSFHWLKGSESLAPLSAAAASLGGVVWYPKFVYESSPVAPDQALSMLRYYGIDEIYLPEDRKVHPAVLTHINIGMSVPSSKVSPLEGLVALPQSGARNGFARHYEALERMMLSPETFNQGYVHTPPTGADPAHVAHIASLAEKVSHISTSRQNPDVDSARITQRSLTTFRIERLHIGRPYLLKYSYSPYWRWKNAESVEELSGMTIIIPHASEVTGTFSRFSDQGFYISFFIAVISALMLVIWNRHRKRGG